MGKKQSQNSESHCDFAFSKHGTDDLEKCYPSLWKAFNSSDSPLLDISTIQTELERILASVMERLICLKCESDGREIPPHIFASLRRRECASGTEMVTQSQSRPSLVVKANPDKPLTLIISQRAQSQTTTHTLNTSVSRSKFCTVLKPRRNSRSSLEDIPEVNTADTSDKSPSMSSYAIPNKFWELMEPYCAEITEANVSYLEGLIRSYQELESSYFQLPSLKPCDIQKVDIMEGPAYKRCKRECVDDLQNYYASQSNHVNNSTPFCTASNMVALANCLQNELKKPIPETSMLGEVAQSLLDSCYKDDVHHNLLNTNINAVHTSEKCDRHTNHNDLNNLSNTLPTSPSMGRAGLDDSSNLISPTHSNPIITSHSNQDSSQIEPPFYITSSASQPLKALAKHLHVSTSYRLEKKISQSIEQLGLFPMINLGDPALNGDTNRHMAAVHTNPDTDESSKCQSSNQHQQQPTKSVARNCSNDYSSSTYSSPIVAGSRKRLTTRFHRLPTSNGSELRTTTCQVSCDRENPTDDSLNCTVKTETRTSVICQCEGRLKSKLKWHHPAKSNHNSLKKKLRALHYKNKLRNNRLHSSKPTSSADKLMKASDTQPLCQSKTTTFIPNGCANSDAEKCTDNSDDRTNANSDNAKQQQRTMQLSNSSSDLYHNELYCENEVYLDGGTGHGDGGNSRDIDLSNKSDPEHCDSDSAQLSRYPFTRNQPANHFPPSSHINNHTNCSVKHEQDTDLGRDSLPTDCGHSIESGGNRNYRHSSHCGITNGGCILNGIAQKWTVTTCGDDIIEDTKSERYTQLTSNLEKPQLSDGIIGTNQSDQKSVESNRLDNLGLGNVTDELCCSNFVQRHSNQINQSSTSSLNHQTPKATQLCDSSSDALTAAAFGYSGDEIGWAITQRQQELRLLCATNHNTLRRLVQAARRDMQRQEIQRRLAIADADVIEAYNRLESYRPQRKPPLKRDRDTAWKALKERRKLLKELEAFDSKSP